MSEISNGAIGRPKSFGKICHISVRFQEECLELAEKLIKKIHN
jgi:hypothetical protein